MRRMTLVTGACAEGGRGRRGHRRWKSGERGDTRPTPLLSRHFSPQTWSEGAGTSSRAHICALDRFPRFISLPRHDPSPRLARVRGGQPSPSPPLPSLPRRPAIMARFRAKRDALCAAGLVLSTHRASAIAASGHAHACTTGGGWMRGRTHLPSPIALSEGVHTDFVSLRALQARGAQIIPPPPSHCYAAAADASVDANARA
ncbi:hypothetical protein K525DRAFT_275781 [Schizophyllum commune Loenen D]|nr:hypothetical protein K525DRAFT_275781 [Schizophyllum commune Loenen D]